MPNEIPTIQRSGIIFRPGSYGTKGEYTESDLEIMAQSAPVPIRMSHYPTMLEGKLGQCHRAFVGFDENGNKVLMGEWSEPKPLADLLEDTPRTLSIEVYPETKKLKAVALEINPHITDAQFFSNAVEEAYVKFSKGEEIEPIAKFAFESTAERDAIADEDFGDPVAKLFPCRTQAELRQCLDELAYAADPTAVKARLVEIATRKGLSIPDYPWRQTGGVSKPLESELAMYSNQENSMNFLIEKQKGTFTQATPQDVVTFTEGVVSPATKGVFVKPENSFQRPATMEEIVLFTAGAVKVGLSDTAGRHMAAAADTGKTPREIELEAQVAAFEAEKAEKAVKNIETQATAKADDLVKSGVIEAKGNEAYNHAVAAFTQALHQDANSEKLAYFSAAEKNPLADFSAVKHLDALYQHAPKFDGSERVSNQDPTNTGLAAMFEQGKTTTTDKESGETIQVVDNVTNSTFTRPDKDGAKAEAN